MAVQTRIILLGPCQLAVNDRPVTTLTAPQIHALVAYLALNADRAHSRATLAELLWPDRPPGRARQNLRQSLSRLQRALIDVGGNTDFLQTSRQEVRFTPTADVWVDVLAFGDALATCQQHQHRDIIHCRRCAKKLATASKLYGDDFLGSVMIDSPELDAWLLAQREHLRHQALAALDTVSQHHLWRAGYLAAIRLRTAADRSGPPTHRGKYGLPRHRHARCARTSPQPARGL